MSHHRRGKPRDPHRRGGYESEGRAAIAKDRARQDATQVDETLAGVFEGLEHCADGPGCPLCSEASA